MILLYHAFNPTLFMSGKNKQKNQVIEDKINMEYFIEWGGIFSAFEELLLYDFFFTQKYQFYDGFIELFIYFLSF